MGFFWEKGPLFVKEMLAFYEEPKPHFNTLSTIVRGLEDKGNISFTNKGPFSQKNPMISSSFAVNPFIPASLFDANNEKF